MGVSIQNVPNNSNHDPKAFFHDFFASGDIRSSQNPTYNVQNGAGCNSMTQSLLHTQVRNNKVPTVSAQNVPINLNAEEFNDTTNDHTCNNANGDNQSSQQPTFNVQNGAGCSSMTQSLLQVQVKSNK